MEKMKRYPCHALLSAVAVALFASGAVAQNQAKPSGYEGLSQPPTGDSIVASPETAPVTAAPAPAPADVATPPAVARPAASPNTDADIVAEVPHSSVASSTPSSTLEPTLYERSVNPDADIVHVAPLGPGELDTGTLIRVRLQEALSSSKTAPGDPFTAVVMAPISQSDKVIIPMGALIKGRVVSVHAGKNMGRKATMRLRPDTVTMPDGSNYLLHAQVVETQGTDTKAGSEGVITTKSHLKRNALEYGAGAGGGAILGAVVGGGTGALVGAGIGAGAVTVHLLMQNHQAQLPKDSVLIFGLTEPMTFTSVQN
jgi:hypothetical protein